MITRPTPAKRVLFWRGVTRACPVCGKRRLTQRVVELVDECPRCGLTFERAPGHFVGAVGMSTIFTFGLILISLLLGIWVLWPDVQFLSLALAPLAIAIFVPLLVHPSAKTLWASIDLMMNPLEPGEALGGYADQAPPESPAT